MESNSKQYGSKKGVMNHQTTMEVEYNVYINYDQNSFINVHSLWHTKRRETNMLAKCAFYFSILHTTHIILYVALGCGKYT